MAMSEIGWVGLTLAGAILVAGGWIASAIRSFHPKAALLVDGVARAEFEEAQRAKKHEHWLEQITDNTTPPLRRDERIPDFPSSEDLK